jgi:two-component system response regulator WspF
VRVAIVNDETPAIDALRLLVLAVPGYSVAWTASDGQEAVERTLSDPPDVILMDLLMPHCNGVEATRRIMKHRPCAILVTTANVAERISLVYEAMTLGALDAFSTPRLGSDGKPQGGEELLARLERLARGRPGAGARDKSPPSRIPQVVALGASTGGPEALARVLSALPPSLPAGVLIVQHIAADFAHDLTQWLGSRIALPVRLAREGDSVRAGEVLIAGTDDHLIVHPDLTVGYTREPDSCVYRPSVDVFFQSLALRWPRPGVSVLLTGMGSDGAKGLACLRQARWGTIAQDEESCVVYGMPRAAVELKAAVQVLPLGKIAAAVLAGLGER